MTYAQRVYQQTVLQNPNQPEFHQALEEILTSLEPCLNEHPEWEKQGLLERLVEPERQIIFRVPWIDDGGNVRVNRGYRVQYNSAIGPYKGGIRFHPSVNLSIMKFLGFEQIFKNSLTGMPIGGGKGGADFDPKNKSPREIMIFCQSFMTELQKYVGADIDVPAGDIGVGAREIGFMYGQFKRIRYACEGALTGKGLSYGGSLGRKEATGFGLIYLAEKILEDIGQQISGKTAIVSGSGNVAIYAAQKLQDLGAKVVAMSDSNGFVYDQNGLDLQHIKQIKEVDYARISTYTQKYPHANYHAKGNIWAVPAQLAFPCATQNELDLSSAKHLISNNCILVAEGANMPTTPQAVEALQKHGILFAPGKAANAGGVSVSALEMSQDSMRLSWTFEEVDTKLKSIMHNIYKNMSDCAARYNHKNNFVIGANIAGFLKVAEALLAQGLV